MTLVSSILKSGFRESNNIAINAAPTADETNEGLPRLQSLVSSVYGNEAGEQLQEFPLGKANISRPSDYPWYGNELPADLVIPINSRMMLNLSGGATVYLHPAPNDGARLGVVDVRGNLNSTGLIIRGNGRNIESSPTLTLNTAGLTRDWFYRADLGNWVKVTDLVLTDEFPFPVEFDDMFITMLAMRLNPRYGQSLASESLEALKRSRGQFRSRYKQTMQVDSELGLIKLTNTQTGYPEWYGNTTDRFNSGYPYSRI